ncbi:hypothetical protein KJ762_14525 [bacterium]|nr:hypothetical protein [bacterium]MBU1063607.1 hypothetical protein [bacterium]MBU1635705.1 hypothetical protein [bacterium]MBU1874528.1 hypothetical protein [bacterium]
MGTSSYAETVNKSKLKAGAIRSHLTDLASRGLDEAYVTTLETDITDTETKNAVQETKKAEQKVATAAVNTALSSLKAKNSEIDKLVKMTLPKETWVEFGITAKQ